MTQVGVLLGGRHNETETLMMDVIELEQKIANVRSTQTVNY